MAVSYVGGSATGAADATTGFTLTVSGSNLVGLASPSWFTNTDVDVVSASFNGQAGTIVGTQLENPNDDRFRAALFKRIAVTTGTVLAVLSGAPILSYMKGAAAADADQSTGVGAPAAVGGTGVTASSSASSDIDQLVVSFISALTNTLVPGAGQTARFTANDWGGNGFSELISTEPGASPTVVMDGTLGTSGNWLSIAVSVLDLGGGPSITSVGGDDQVTSIETAVAIVGTGFDNVTVDFEQGAVSLEQDLNSQSATTLSIDVVFDPGAPGNGPHLKYGAADAIVTNVDLSDATRGITITVPTGRSFVNVGTPNPDSSIRLDTIPAPTSGDQIEISSVVGGSISDVVVNVDLTWNAADTVTAFTFRLWAASDASWGGPGVQTVNAPSPSSGGVVGPGVVGPLGVVGSGVVGPLGVS